MSKIVDLPRIQAALKKLDQIAVDHPELCGGGGKWTEEAVAQMIRQTGGTPAKQRVAAYRQRLAERGYKREIFFVSPQGQAALMKLREQFPDKTRDQIFEDALFTKLAKVSSNDPDPAITTPTPEPVTPPTVDYSREARAARRRRVVELCGDAVRRNASSKEVAAILEAHGVKSEDGTAMLPQTARLWVRQADAKGA